MMAKDHPFIGHQEIATVFEALSRRRSKSVERENLRRNELAVKAVAEGVTAGRCCNQPKCVNRLFAMNGYCGDGQRTQGANGPPSEKRQSLSHVRSALCRICRRSATLKYRARGFAHERFSLEFFSEAFDFGVSRFSVTL